MLPLAHADREIKALNTCSDERRQDTRLTVNFKEETNINVYSRNETRRLERNAASFSVKAENHSPYTKVISRYMLVHNATALQI